MKDPSKQIDAFPPRQHVPVEKVLERIRERKAAAGTRLSPEEILARRDADRR